MNWYYLEKEYYDYSDDIEAVSIHYVCTPLGGVPDWENRGLTHYMPVPKPISQVNGQTGTLPPPSDLSTPTNGRLRKKVLKLPPCLPDLEDGNESERYLLYYYFEVCQDGSRHYSRLYVEEVATNAQTAENSPPQ